MDQTPNVEWIGVAEVAAEMNLTDRGAWELLKRLGVPIVEGERARMKSARFRRSDWIAARDRSMGPAPSRAPYRGSFTPSPLTPPRPAAGLTPSNVAADKLKRLRSIK